MAEDALVFTPPFVKAEDLLDAVDEFTGVLQIKVVLDVEAGVLGQQLIHIAVLWAELERGRELMCVHGAVDAPPPVEAIRTVQVFELLYPVVYLAGKVFDYAIQIIDSETLCIRLHD